MVVISGNSLGERQRDLNSKVAEVIATKKDFNKFKTEEDTNDLDKLYKIDIASQYRDIDYIIEVLKSGDSLCVSRALKCLWLYHDDYSHIICAENLHSNIFPYMSIKMKKKMLSGISMHIRNDNRASNFFLYCKKNKMTSIAFKFLNFTSEEFKLDVLENDGSRFFFSYLDTETKLEYFIGKSFVLAISWIKSIKWLGEDDIHKLRFLYSVNGAKYLDILEEYESIDVNKIRVIKRFGIRISKDIMIRHKQRVLEKPLLYVNILNKCMLVKYSTSDDAKKYLTTLLPKKVEQFWDLQYLEFYNFIMDLIPVHEKFQYLKQLFNSKYPGNPFEINHRFYQLKYYKIMSSEEKELWALRHLEDKKEYLGKGNDYILYQFVNFDKAFVELKKYIMNSPDMHRRAGIVNILLDAVRDEKDLAKVLNYYYDRHVNENANMKELFIDKLLNDHKVFEFNSECWEALNKLFNSLEIYIAGRHFGNMTYRAVAVACHILHDQPMPQALVDFIDLDINYHYFGNLLDKFGKEKSEIIFQYLVKFFVVKLQPFEEDPHNKKLRKNLKSYVNNIFTLLGTFRKEDKECPEIARKFIEIDSPTKEDRKTITEKDIFRFLKTDIQLAVDVLSHFEKNINDWPKRLNNVLRKLKVYFPNDVAPQFLTFLDRWLPKHSGDFGTYRLIDAAIFGIFQLADKNFKIALMEKYQPLGTKIDYRDTKLHTIQEAICRYVGYSRPPVPLENVLKYIKGDYVRFCLPMFNMYLVNLSLPLVMEFTEAIINAPISVQKHGLRIAFKCYTNENLKTLVLNVWKKTKNLSLRTILYKSLFNKITGNDADEDTQAELYEALKLFTLDIHEDEDDLFNLIISNRMSQKFIGDYLLTGWDVVIKLPEKPSKIEKQIKIMRCIENNMDFFKRDSVRMCIINEHIQEFLETRGVRSHELSGFEDLCKAKWELTAKYIVQYSNSIELEDSLSLVKLIFSRCLRMWNEHDESFLIQKFYFNFISTIKNKSVVWSETSRHIFEHIIVLLKEALPMKEIYLTLWQLQLAIYARISVSDTTITDSDIDSDKQLVTDEIEHVNIKFANHIGKFIQELLLKDHFYPIFLPKIANIIKMEVRCMELHLRKTFGLTFCESLASIGMKETHLLTLMILPVSVPEELKANHTRILKTVQTFENDEVQTYLYYLTVVAADYKKKAFNF